MAIVNYSKQNEFDLTHSEQNCMGWTVVDETGNPVGKVTEIQINTETQMVSGILINNDKHVPANDFELVNKRVVVRGAGHNREAANNPAVTHFAANTANQNYANNPAAATNADYVNPANIRGESEVAVPVIEEQLRVGKQEVETGGARVHTNHQEVPVEQQVSLREENVVVERRPVNQPITPDTNAFQEGVIEITLQGEVPIISKEARVVEEVLVGKQVEEHVETIRETVHNTTVEVEQIDPDEARRRAVNR
ncbi:MAG TPA: PRC and DUF2382 domain-containing protein [Pyrinomonadaceae bacterium]|nr:PRC and DUF2382 domain-containing protein [Pyrinomonadaceae bacterium]